MKATTTAGKPARVCQLCGNSRAGQLQRAVLVRPSVSEVIERDAGRWDPDGWICLDDLQKYRDRYVQTLLEAEKSEITELEREVIESLRENDTLARNPEDDYESDRTIGQRLADRIATFGGSWTFVLSFAAVLFLWMFLNSALLVARPFDPFPYIFLNLILSCLAAVQAPLIMMSQQRQESRDRLRSMHDYQVNLKAELEIRHLHQKVDHLLSNQWERLIEIQEIQMELVNELRSRR